MRGWSFVAVGLGVVATLGCATQTKMTRLGPGTYELECQSSLASCLVSAQEPCRAHGYDVLSATERREYVADHPEAHEWVKASAKVRCREAVPLFGPDPNAPPPPASALVPAPLPSTPAPAAPAATVVAPAPSAPAAPAAPAAPSSPSAAPPAPVAP